MSMSSGPRYGRTGMKWSYNPTGRISTVRLSHGSVIHGIKFCSVDGAGRSTWSETFGDGFSGDKHVSDVCIRYPDEKLAEIQGTRRILCNKGPWVITSLTFTTNLSSYGPFGQVTGTNFIFPNLAGKIITNFNGRAAMDFLYAIGIKFIPCTGARGNPTRSEETMHTLLQVFERKIKEVNDLVDGNSIHVTETSSFHSPISSLKGKIRAIVCGGLEKLSSDAFAPLYLEVIEKKKAGFTEGDNLVVLKLKVAMEMMEEIKTLGELKNKLNEQKVEYMQEYARRDDYFKFVKKSDEKLLQSDDIYKSNQDISALLTKFQLKAQKLKKLKEQISVLETKKKFAFDLLMAIGC